MRPEPVARFIVIGAGRIVGMLGAPRLVHEPARLLGSVPEPAHAALLTVLPPELRVDVTAHVERRDEFVPMPCRAGWKIGRSREVESNALEGVWQPHQRTLHIMNERLEQ